MPAEPRSKWGEKLYAGASAVGSAKLAGSLNASLSFHDIVKVGGTQPMDAVPMRLGDEFGAFAVPIGEDIDRVTEVSNLLREINLGGTAIGSCINTPPGRSS